MVVDRHDIDLDRRQVAIELHDLRTGVRAHRLDARARGSRVVCAERKPDERHGRQEARDVVVEAEDRRAPRRLVHAHVVEDQRAALMRVGEHVDGRLGPGQQAAVDPEEAVRSRRGGARRHGHERIPDHPAGTGARPGATRGGRAWLAANGPRNPATPHRPGAT